jgi:Na+/H+-dicarboxylate symporter
MATGDVLQIIFFTIFFAIMAAMVGGESETLTKAINAVDLIMQRSVMVVMLIAPYCIFLLNS